MQIVDVKTVTPCPKPPAARPEVRIKGPVMRDSMYWPKVDNKGNRTGDTIIGSGVIIGFSVVLTELGPLGCTQACWVQGVKTHIEQLKSGADPANPKSWKTLEKTDWHNDNINMEDRTINGEKADWRCYAAQSVKNGKLEMGDGPHLVHSNKYRFNGKTFNLPNGTVLRRTSDFYTALICLKPQSKIIDALSWTLSTIFTVGGTGKSAVDGPHREPLNNKDPRLKAALSAKKMKKFLKQKKK